MNRTHVIYHRADFDGIFCREIARKFLPHANLIGWDYGDLEPVIDPQDQLYILDLSVPGLMDHPNLIWIDHHKSAIETYPASIPGYRIDGVAACRLAWQWFNEPHINGIVQAITKQDFIDRKVDEPLAVRLAGEYDVWDKRDERAELFQHGLRSCELSENMWELLLTLSVPEQNGKQCIGDIAVGALLESGEAVQYATQRSNDSIIKEFGFTFQWEGLTFLACNSARYNSHLFTAGIRPEHDALFGFNWTGSDWRVSLYGVPGKPDVDLSAIAKRHGGGGHKQACGFRTLNLPFPTTR